MYPRARPQIGQRLCWRTLYLGLRRALAIMHVLAICHLPLFFPILIAFYIFIAHSINSP
jgi:hypothetical protein